LPIVKRSEIDEGLQECDSDLQSALQRFNVSYRVILLGFTGLTRVVDYVRAMLCECPAGHRSTCSAQAVNNRTQRNMVLENMARHEELKAMLMEAFTKPSETAQIIAMERTGSHVAEQLMQAGQEVGTSALNFENRS
jgi:hypothetical protein